MAIAFSIDGKEWAGELAGGGYKAVTTAGTRVRYSTTLTPCAGAVIQALAGNVSDVTVGGSDVVGAAGTTHIGINLSKGDSIYIPIRDLSQLWFDSITSGDAAYVNPIK